MTNSAEQTERLQRLVEPVVGGLGFGLVRIQISGKQSKTVQVMVEREDDRGMTVDDCAQVSRAISAVLDVEDPIPGSYRLEVSSPGIDRPLVRLGDFERFKGFEARIETHALLDGRKRFKGRLMGVDGDLVKILVDGREMNLSHPDINRAKLLLTDDLIAAAEESNRQ